MDLKIKNIKVYSMKSTSTYILIGLFILFNGCKQEDKSPKNWQVTQYKKFISEMNSRGFTTGNILVYENGEVIFQNSDGLRNIIPKDSLTLASQFRLASVSKQFTGVAIMKLKQQGKLDYNQKVNTILTDFPYDNITIKHLLRHTSGLADYEEIIANNFLKHDVTKRYVLGNNEILKVFLEVNPKLNFEPGEEWEYSNTGYMVLASIVEKVSKMHFRDFLKIYLFEPLKMNNTTLYKYQEAEDSNMPNRVFGYYKGLNQKDLFLHDYDIVNDVRGDGGIYSTLQDLFKWNMALANYKVLPKAYFEEAWSWGTLNNGKKTRYGFGWKFLKDKTKPKTVFHAGEWVGFGTYLLNEYETKGGYIVLTNDNTPNYKAITDAIDSIRVNAPYVLPKKSIVESMAKIIFSENIENAITFFNNKRNDSLNFFIDEYQMNTLGYGLLNKEKLDEALVVFKINTKEFPTSANVYDSYGDALLIKGDSAKALKNFKTAYKLNNSFNHTKDKILMLTNPLKALK